MGQYVLAVSRWKGRGTAPSTSPRTLPTTFRTLPFPPIPFRTHCPTHQRRYFAHTAHDSSILGTSANTGWDPLSLCTPPALSF